MRRSGFTLMEIMAVMAIIAVLLLAVVPNIDNQVPHFRLRGGAREVASTIELAQSQSVTERKVYAIRYDLDRGTYQILLPPADEEDAGEDAAEESGAGDLEGALGEGMAGADPQDDIEHGPPPPPPADAEEEAEPDDEEREGLGERSLPDDVRFVLVKEGERSHRRGKVVVRFSAVGNEGAHVVGLGLRSDAERGEGGGEQVWVKFNPLTRSIEFAEREPEVRTLDPEGGR
ncbi:MAG: prepilin-type N-terminal cleavage/methylation domain-containing protein [Planctomycetota bacterium]|nr:MAG: prepilin-type N-terminal cleavage/methylation domain-containing protein [Planctomycetota bacterium]